MHVQALQFTVWAHDCFILLFQWLVEGLKQKGHRVRLAGSVSTPTGILQMKPGQIFSDAPGFVVDGF